MLIATPVLSDTVMEEKNPLFTDLTAEECATVSGGSTQISFDINTFLFILGASVVFGKASSDPVLAREEFLFAWENSFVFGGKRKPVSTSSAFGG